MVAGSVLYLDASALVKLILSESETAALTTFLGERATVVTSRLAEIEVIRAVARIAQPGDVEHANEVLEGVRLIEIDTTVSTLAKSVAPTVLRSVDAIHLASALTIASELDAFVTYDLRLADAARDAGLTVVAPA